MTRAKRPPAAEEAAPSSPALAAEAQPSQRGRARKYALVMEQIHAAAIEVFAAEGAAGATTQAIADRAGLSKAQLHYYIDTKDALYREVLQNILDDWVAVFGYEDEAQGPRKVLGDYIRRKMNFSFEEPLRSRIFAAEMMRGGPVALALMGGNSGRRTWQADSVIRHWIQRGLMAPVEPLLFLFHLWAITQFYADQAQQVHLFMPGELDSAEGRERLIQEVTLQIFRAAGLEPAVPVRAPD
ncbi:TetR family transcriptional regulator C-terminal domain-containing protein [Xenophilus sp. Marseille-Q4582]|uniref:TetR family transcriptional regulator C-terminal domain-containing protein n=1 Tax=Xenophilus sp. Marseille-Q4582 TaxID=2866600 RepID=UPI001CE3FB21|nr:TetR family transcriptional regulator C-terminal domain-containing protein [Xenophilus sp. Marseille-Q4582]